MRVHGTSLFCIFLFFLLRVDASFYFSPNQKNYQYNGTITAETVKLTSIPRAIPFGYYTFFRKDLPFCKPEHPGGHCDLGQCISGDWIQKTNYTVNVGQNNKCIESCIKKPDTDEDYINLREMIKWEYRAQLTLDGLPIAMNNTEGSRTHFDIGYPIGHLTDEGQYLLYNHLAIKIQYVPITNASCYITSVTVKPYSFNFGDHDCELHDDDNEHFRLDITNGSKANPIEIRWSYSVTWENDPKNTSYSDRWDRYFEAKDDLHAVSLTYAIIVAVALTLFLGIVLVRIIRTSATAKFNFDDLEESGWKTLHGDVFRPPRHFMILSVLVGGGAQLLGTAFVIILLGFIGFLSPARSGSLNYAIVLVYPFLGFVSGYTSARVYSRLGGGRKRRNGLFTAVGLNGLIFGIYFIADIILWANDSSAGRASIFFSLLALWIFVNTPLCFLGAFFAHRRPNGENPVGTNTIPRMVPPAPWYSHTYLLTPLLAILPFGVSFNEVYDLMEAMWSHHVYYFFNYVLVIFVLLTIIIAEVSVVLCYFSLANENYHWWWRAFYIPGMVVVYIFLMAMFFVGMDLELKSGASVFLYLSYTAIMLLVFFVFMSSVAFYACWTFVHKIYSTLHVD
eukprot:Phypoly_transcript_05604.p1 GENE.Phypoly_transcript_05604~~Phypoly_transcript_05604.p1  ORF type:complete len:620 (+),score=103.10 Phypoly_transcript_05604:34-1893(+)